MTRTGGRSAPEEIDLRCPAPKAGVPVIRGCRTRQGSQNQSAKRKKPTEMALIRITFLIETMLTISGLLFTIPAYGGKGVNLVVAVDTSGSMRYSDPRDLRSDSVRLITELLRRNDRLCLIAFDEDARVMLPLETVKKARSSLKKTRKRTPSSGKLTNIYEALRKSYAVLSEPGAGEGTIILLTDGRMDLGSGVRDAELKRKVIEELLPRIRKSGIRVYTIGLSGRPDRDFLDSIAATTGGLFYPIDKGRTMHIAFADILNDIRTADMLPLRDRRFHVDSSVEEIKIIATRANPGRGIAIELPDRTIITGGDHPETTYWYSAKFFDVIILREPPTGTWKIHYSDGASEIVLIMSALRLMVSVPGDALTPGDRITLTAYLREGDRILKMVPLILEEASFDAEITTPSGEHAGIGLHDDGRNGDGVRSDGIYTARFVPDEPGTYSLRVTVRGKTFEREEKFTLRVRHEPPAVKKAATKAPVTDAEKSRRTKEGKVKPLSGANQPERAGHGGPSLSEEQPEKAEGGVSWMDVLIRFLVINIFAAALSGTILLTIRKWKGGKKNDQD